MKYQDIAALSGPEALLRGWVADDTRQREQAALLQAEIAELRDVVCDVLSHTLDLLDAKDAEIARLRQAQEDT